MLEKQIEEARKDLFSWNCHSIVTHVYKFEFVGMSMICSRIVSYLKCHEFWRILIRKMSRILPGLQILLLLLFFNTQRNPNRLSVFLSNTEPDRNGRVRRASLQHTARGSSSAVRVQASVAANSAGVAGWKGAWREDLRKEPCGAWI